MNLKPILPALMLWGTCALASPASAQVRLPRLVRDSMILQREAPMRIWGWAHDNEEVTVTFNRKKYRTKAGSDGRWITTLPAMKAGGPYTMQIDASNHIELKDVLIGDVWLCSGQSNMVHQMELHSVRYASEISNANNPMIRHFWVPNVTDLQSSHDDLPGGSWKWANPRDIGEFSAVAYFFGKALYEKYKVPIGLINASWGGSPIEAWMSEDALKAFPDMLSVVERNKDSAYVNRLMRGDANPDAAEKDRGLEGSWFSSSYTPKGWRSIFVPGYWEDQGLRDLNGVVWYRKEINVPAAISNQPATVFLGRIVDADVFYINGQRIGTTTYQYPQRRYQIPAGILKPGKNVLVVRVTNTQGKGGFVPDKPYQLFSGADTIALSGEWQYKVGQVFAPRAPAPGFTTAYQPAALYHAMIAPLQHYALRGFVWYQGESNTGRAAQYAALQPAMIADWRAKWQLPAAPFLFVQLPGFGDMNYWPAESQWATFREAQAQTLSVPNTAMAVAIDLGEWNDVHPDRKKEVGDRLALAARKLSYGESALISSGPVLQSARVDGARIIISFTNTGTGLVVHDEEPLSDFAIAGADKKFVRAQAKIKGDKVIVWNDAMDAPRYVRYAWSDCPVDPNLFNQEGLPAAPFRTDGPIDSTTSLKSHFKNLFPIGVAVSPWALKSDEGPFILQQFSSLTPENAMKMASIHPKENEYNWKDADSIVAFAQQNHLKLRGHTLVWHNQTPSWLFVDDAGNTVSKVVLLERLRQHIMTVVSRYKGKIYAWDVVNEAISDKPDEFLRPSKWLEIIGEEYIAKAYQWAHEADPDTQLFYNDYNEINTVKREKIFRLISELKKQGIPVHGLGLQAHWAINEPSRAQLDSTLSRFAQLGCSLQITEMDISIYPKEHNARERRNGDQDTVFTAEREQLQAAQYAMCFDLFRIYSRYITGVTFWNVSDRASWLDNFPVRNRKDYPLLFNKNLQPKKAYWAILQP